MTRGGGVVVRLKGLHKVRRKLSDGSYRTHYYAWRGGPRVEGEAGTPEFIASYNRAVQDRCAPLKNSFASVVSSYKRSARHLDLVSKSRTDECRYLDAILDKFGAAPIRAFDDARMRKDIRDWHSRLQGDRSADMALGVLRKSWAMQEMMVSSVSILQRAIDSVIVQIALIKSGRLRNWN